MKTDFRYFSALPRSVSPVRILILAAADPEPAMIFPKSSETVPYRGVVLTGATVKSNQVGGTVNTAVPEPSAPIERASSSVTVSPDLIVTVCGSAYPAAGMNRTVALSPGVYDTLHDDACLAPFISTAAIPSGFSTLQKPR